METACDKMEGSVTGHGLLQLRPEKSRGQGLIVLRGLHCNGFLILCCYLMEFLKIHLSYSLIKLAWY